MMLLEYNLGSNPQLLSLDEFADIADYNTTDLYNRLELRARFNPRLYPNCIVYFTTSELTRDDLETKLRSMSCDELQEWIIGNTFKVER